jgi:hypothetical protein
MRLSLDRWARQLAERRGPRQSARGEQRHSELAQFQSLTALPLLDTDFDFLAISIARADQFLSRQALERNMPEEFFDAQQRR